MRSKTLYMLFFLILLLYQEIYGGSLYGNFGIGERQYAVSARSLGMGGVNIALSDKFTLSSWNPAQWSQIRPVRVNFRSLTNYNSVKGGSSSIFTEFNGFSMGIPMGSKFSVGGSVYPISGSEYALSQSGSVNDENWNLTITGNGGINAFGLGIAYQVTENFAFGIKHDWLFGRKEEEWVTRFDNSNLLSSKFITSKSFDGGLITVGIFSKKKNLNYAGSVTMPLKFSIKKEISYQTIAANISPEKEIDYPTEIRLGLTYDFGGRYDVGFEYQQSDWNSFESDFNGKFGSAYNIFGGIERKVAPRNENFFGRLAIRSGFTLRQLYTHGLGETAISEKSLTLGLGIPTNGGKEIVDIGISYGLRGSGNNKTQEETTFLFMLGFSAGDNWFVRRRR